MTPAGPCPRRRRPGRLGTVGYLRRPGETAFVPFALTVLRIADGHVAEIAAFEQPSMFTAFGQPASLPS